MIGERLWSARSVRALSFIAVASAWLLGCTVTSAPPPQTAPPEKEPEVPPGKEPERPSACKRDNPTEDVLAALALRSIQAFGRADADVFDCADGKECQRLKLNAALERETPSKEREEVASMLELIRKDDALSRALATGYRKSRQGCSSELCGPDKFEVTFIGRDACSAKFALKAVAHNGLAPARLERLRTLYGGGGLTSRIRPPAPLGPSGVDEGPALGTQPQRVEPKGQGSAFGLLMQVGSNSGIIEVPTYWDPSCDASNGTDSCYVAAYDAPGFCHEMSGPTGAKARAGECCQIFTHGVSNKLKATLSLARCP